MAASVAIHAIALLWPTASDTVAVYGQEVAVEIISADEMDTSAIPHAQVKLQRQETLHAATNPVADYAGRQQVQKISSAREQVSGELPSAADLAERESAVRTHLEQFKYYPASARRRQITGVVEVAFVLGSGGHAGMVKILKGSGYSLLDDAALETVRRADPFPAEDGNYQFRLRFRAS